MKTASKRTSSDSMRPEYDFSAGKRGKYAQRFVDGTNLVLLDGDVAAMFPDSQSVNQALRKLAEIIRQRARRGAASP